MTEAPRPRRPAFFTSGQLDAVQGGLDPATVTQVSHETAAVIVGTGRASDDPAVTARLLRLVDELGLDTLAELWADRPARTLPGVLWRLYLLHEWVRRSPRLAAREYRDGMARAQVSRVVAGVAEPPGPEEVAELTDTILRGVFTGDLAVALERAAAFCRVVSAGRAEDARTGLRELRSASSLLTTAEDLEASAGLWRRESLV